MKSIILLGAIQMFLFLSCDKSEEERLDLKLSLNVCQNYGTGNEAIKVCFQKVVADSRCPKNASCITAGEGVADFLVTRNGNSFPIRLSTANLYGVNRHDTIMEGYKIEFVNLYPYPELNTPPSTTPEAAIKITKI